MRLLNISNEYWEEYVNPSEQFELIRSPDFTVKSPTPLNLGSPVTPEVTPGQLNKMIIFIITSFLYLMYHYMYNSSRKSIFWSVYLPKETSS